MSANISSQLDIGLHRRLRRRHRGHSAKFVSALIDAGVMQAPRINAQEGASTLWAAATPKQEAPELRTQNLLVPSSMLS